MDDVELLNLSLHEDEFDAIEQELGIFDDGNTPSKASFLSDEGPSIPAKKYRAADVDGTSLSFLELPEIEGFPSGQDKGKEHNSESSVPDEPLRIPDVLSTSGNGLVSIFIVKFDVNEGNIVEYCYPPAYNVDGLEFKAMASGCHGVKSDVIYFKTGDDFGVACFAKKSVDDRRERGVRMRSVGVVMPSFSALSAHIPFLRKQARLLNMSAVIESFSELSRYFHGHTVSEKVHSQGARERSLTYIPIGPDPLKGARVGRLGDVLRFFGPAVFSLWKCLLARKRILFLSKPPISLCCHFVYCSSLIARTNVQYFKFDPCPLFYVNINDAQVLEDEPHFVACTTESIFEKKGHLFDVFIKNHELQFSSVSPYGLAGITDGDRVRYAYLQQLVEQRNELELLRFFVALNNRVFDGLRSVMESSAAISSDELPDIFGLHTSDAPYLRHLIEALNLRISISSSTRCFPGFRC